MSIWPSSVAGRRQKKVALKLQYQKVAGQLHNVPD